MTTVVYHSADYDGIFCREIAKHFLGEKDVEYIGWNFGDPRLRSIGSVVYILDLSPDCLFGLTGLGQRASIDEKRWLERIIWIDHHKTSIDKWPLSIPGYRIDGVAACRLAWQWFKSMPEHATPNFAGRGVEETLPSKQDFIDRKVSEPIAVRLAGEYDIWDKRDLKADTFQYALRVHDSLDWATLITVEGTPEHSKVVDYLDRLLASGEAAQSYAQKTDADLVTHRSFRLKWEGLDFLCLNTGRFNSLTFAALDKPETGHDALLGFMWNGKVWTYSLYHANHRKDLDLSGIAVKHGGGGHRGACGWTSPTQILPL